MKTLSGITIKKESYFDTVALSRRLGLTKSRRCMASDS